MREVPNMARPSQRCGPPSRTLQDRFIQPQWEKDLTFLLTFPCQSHLYFVVNPSTLDSALRENKKQLVLHMNSLVNFLPHIITWLEVVWGKPAAYAMGLQIRVQTCREAFIDIGVANETGIILDRMQNTLFPAPPELHSALEEIYKYPLQETARDTLNRQLRSGINDEQLAALVIDLRAENRLCQVHERLEEVREPQIICSLGLFDSTMRE